tara:strand:- start:595 stop:975 length:381 start_codon:yes stop_codon:yes gene_type:complete
MKYPSITKKILSEGITSINPEALPQHLRKEIFSEATVSLFKEKRHKEASKSLKIANNPELAMELTAYLEKAALFQTAALYVPHTENPEKIEYLAFVCLENEYFQESTMLFQHLGREEMIAFIEANR